MTTSSAVGRRAIAVGITFNVRSADPINRHPADDRCTRARPPPQGAGINFSEKRVQIYPSILERESAIPWALGWTRQRLSEQMILITKFNRDFSQDSKINHPGQLQDIQTHPDRVIRRRATKSDTARYRRWPPSLRLDCFRS